MPLLGRSNGKKKDKKQASPAAAPSSGSGIKVKDLLKVVGVEKVDDNTEDKNVEQLTNWWQYLRGRIDQGSRQFFETGETKIFEEHLEEPVLREVIRHLDSLRSQNIVWIQPKRKKLTNPKFRFFDVRKEGTRVVSFRVRERFVDHSQHVRIENEEMVDQREAPGSELIIEAEVKVLQGPKFRLLSVTAVPSV